MNDDEVMEVAEEVQTSDAEIETPSMQMEEVRRHRELLRRPLLRQALVMTLMNPLIKWQIQSNKVTHSKH